MAAELAERLRKAREAAGLDITEASVDVSRMLGWKRGSGRQTIARYESGEEPAGGMNPLVLAALASLYGVKLSELSPEAEKKLAPIRDLLARSR